MLEALRMAAERKVGPITGRVLAEPLSDSPWEDITPTIASFTAGKHWFAVYTKIKYERRVQAELAAKGVRAYLPEMTKWVSHARVRKLVKRPLLTRYLFAEVDPSMDGFDAIRLTDGVEYICGNSGCPMVISRELVEKLLCKQLSGDFDYASKEPMTKGCKVKVVSGEWDDLIGIITDGSTANGGAVMVKLLGERQAVRLKAHSVRALVS